MLKTGDRRYPLFVIARWAVRSAMARLRLIWLCLPAAASIAWGAADHPAASSAGKLERVVLQLKWKHQFQFAGYYAALERGYYREAGLDVELVEAQPGIDPVEAVLDGHAQFGVGTSELVLLRARGEPVVVLAVIFQHSPLVLIAGGSGAETDLQGLHDRPLMIEPQSAELFAYFRNEGVAPERLRIVPHTFSVDDLVAGRVGAMTGYSTDEPFLLQSLGVPHTILSPRSGGIDFYGDNLFTTEEQIRAHPNRVRAFRAASLRGWEYALAHPEEIIELILRRHGARKSREHLRFEAARTAQLMHPELIQVGHMNPGRWRHIADTYADFGMVPKGFPVEDMLHDPDPRPDPRPWYWALGIAAALALGALGWLLPLVRLNRRLRRGERQYRLLAEHAPFPVIISDAESGRLVFANRLAAELLAAPPETLFGRPAVEFYFDPNDRASLLAGLDRAPASTGVREIRLKNSRGAPFWALLSAGRVDFDGRAATVVAFHDITRAHEMREELCRAKESAEAANVLRSRYLAVMSHEISTPVNGIRGLAELMLREDSGLSPAQRENLQVMQTASEGLLRLVHELLDWSRLEVGALPVQNAPVVLEEFVPQLLGLFRPSTEAKGVQLAHVVAPDVPPVIVTDPLRLRQILSNLLSNAVKFTDSGRVALAVEPGPTRADGGRCIRFVVTDTGPGVPREAAELIFAPFTQADASVARRYGGSGLGLSISRGLARLLGGDLTLWSETGIGSTFTLEIALATPEPA